MPGIIVGSFGFQRSGKTLISYLLAEKFRKQGCEVYSNMTVENWHLIDSLNDIPFDYKPKVLLLDEVYFFLDSRNWANNTNSSIFFNTIGKQNILLIITAISPDTVEKRLRDQLNYCFLVKSNQKVIQYKMLDVQRRKSKVFTLNKENISEMDIRYDTTQVPEFVDCSLKKFREKVTMFNSSNSLSKASNI